MLKVSRTTHPWIWVSIGVFLLGLFFGLAVEAQSSECTLYTNGVVTEELCEGKTSAELQVTVSHQIDDVLMIGAAYENGVLTSVSAVHRALKAGENTVKTGETLVTDDTEVFKVYLWDAHSMEPVTNRRIEIERHPRLKSFSVTLGSREYAADIDQKTKTVSLNVPIYYVENNTNIKQIPKNFSGYEGTPSAEELLAALKAAAPKLSASKDARVIGDVSRMDFSCDNEIVLEDTKTGQRTAYKVSVNMMTLQRDTDLGGNADLVTPATTTYHAGSNPGRHNAPLKTTRLGSGIWTTENFAFSSLSQTSYDPKTDRTAATPAYNTPTETGLRMTKDRDGAYALCAMEGSSPKSGVVKTVNDFSFCINAMRGDGMKILFGKNRFSLKIAPKGENAARLFIGTGTDFIDTGREISFGETYDVRFITSAADDETARAELYLNGEWAYTAEAYAAAAYRLDRFHVKYLFFENTRAEVLLKSWKMCYLKAETENAALSYTGLTEEQQKSVLGFERRLEKIYPWLASLYDKETGGFYMAVSGRDDTSMQPALEMTFFALGMVKGYGDCWSGLPESVKQKFIKFITDRQDPETGLFIDKQGKTNDRETARNQSAVLGWVDEWNITLPYRHPSQNSAPKKSAAQTVALSASKVAAGNTADGVVPDYLRTTETYLNWMDAWDWENDSWTAGDQVSNSLVYLAYLDDSDAYKKVLLAYLAEKQVDANGLWSHQLNFNSISGAFKVSLIYQQLGVQMPNADKVIKSTAECMANDTPDVAHYARNPLSLLYQISLYGDSDAAAARKAVLDNIDRILSWTEKFSCPDGGYSQFHKKSMKSFGGVVGSHELYEGDVDSTLMILVLRTELYRILDLDPPKISCGEGFWESFL